MTAPDDVRARFEAWLASQGFTSKPEQRPNGKYVNGQIQGNWLAWQAAHADLSGEVRELVEGANRALTAWDNTTLPRVNDGMFQERMESLRAALAKFAHPHQCAGDSE